MAVAFLAELIWNISPDIGLAYWHPIDPVSSRFNPNMTSKKAQGLRSKECKILVHGDVTKKTSSSLIWIF